MRSVKRKTVSAESRKRPRPLGLPNEQPPKETTLKLEFHGSDPLLWDFDLPLRGTYFPMGFPLEIATNSPAVLLAAQESWGKFQKIYSTPPLHLRLGVLPGSSQECPPEPACRGQRNLITLVADAENYVVSDTREGFAFGWLTEAAAQKSVYFRYHFLEGTVWILLECLYLTSVHAACVSLEGRGVLLCGDEGAGKSSLSYACARNGWAFLTDDSTMLLRKSPGRVVIGNPYQMRFRESATELFPELNTQSRSERLSGELAIELETATVPGIVTTSECMIDYLVFLNRYHPGPEGLFRFPKEQAQPWLEQVARYGEQQLRDEHVVALRRLAAAEVFEMRYTKIDTALGLLEGLVREVPASAHPRLFTAGKR